MPEPSAEIANHYPLSDRCDQYLRGLLLEGGLQPNEPLSVEAVAATLNVSRQPAMEAVKRLAADGFVVILPQIGCRVVQPEPDHVADFYRLFALAEALIARLAAARRTPQEAADFMALTGRIAADAPQASERGRRYRTLGRLRYAALHAMARSPIAAAIVSGMWDRSDFYIRSAFGSLAFSDAVIRAYAAIADAIAASDGTAAAAETEAYLTEIGAQTARQLRRNPAPAG